jgi:hypothetical protein
MSTMASADPDIPGRVELISGWSLQDAAKISAGGSEVSSVGYRESGWHRAVVPGTVLTNLVRDGVYPEPLYGLNNLKIPESLARTTYWYRTTFIAPKIGPDRHLWLDLEGINWAAVVWIDGHRAGEIRGAFARGIFDIGQWVKPGQRAALAVMIAPPPHPGVPHEQSVLRGTGPNGGIIGRDSPTFMANIGWDWIPGIRDRSSGIWQSVSLFTTGPVNIDDPYVRTEVSLPRTDSADLTVQTTVRNLESHPVSGKLSGQIPGTSVSFELPVDLAANETREISLSPKDAPALHMAHPRLWWPNGYGKQDLYRLKLSFTPTGSAVSDQRLVSFGVRSISYFREGSKDLSVIVNGVPIFCDGGNWGMDEAMKRIPRDRLEAQIRMHHDANLTMIRNWVGQSTEEDFYDLCDRYGILVWNDFALANPYDGPNPDDPDMFLDNAREILLRYRNHPSIAIWCGRNEGYPPEKINDGLAKMIAQLDGVRFYQPHSSSVNGVGGGGPYGLRPFSQYFTTRDAFHTEVGMPSVPTLEAIHEMMPKEDWDTLNDDWAYHDLTRGAQDGDRYVGDVQDRFGPLNGLPDFVRKAELMSYSGYRAMFEGREASMFAPSNGVLLWMTHPSQPSFVWQLYSYDLEPTAALFGSMKACEPIHIQLDARNNDIEIVNHSPNTLTKLTARALTFSLAGKPLSTTIKRFDAQPSSTSVALTLPAETIDQPRFVRLELKTQANDVVSRNDYFLGSTAAPNDLSGLAGVPDVEISAKSTSTRIRERESINVYLSNPSKTPCYMIHVQLREARSGRRVLPVFYSDNFVNLLPGESKTIKISVSAKDLNGEAPKIVIDGWNLSHLTPQPNDRGVICSLNPDMPRSVAARSGIIRINCGGGWTGPFTAEAFHNDEFYSSGRPSIAEGDIDISRANLPPSEKYVYNSERSGECQYTVPVENRPYTVRLHFCETSHDQPGERKFNVAIDGNPVLADFDIFAEAGGRGKAIVKLFKSIRPDPSGHISIQLTKGSADKPEIRAIELIPE